MSKSKTTNVRQFQQVALTNANDTLVIPAYNVPADHYFRLTDFQCFLVGNAAGSFWITTGGVGVGRVYKALVSNTIGFYSVSFITPLEFIGNANIYVTAQGNNQFQVAACYSGQLREA